MTSSEIIIKEFKEFNLEEGYPTASISIISLGNDDWHDLGNKKLELIKFIRPRDLNN